MPLSRERIIAAAVKLVDAEGLGALSMRRLGRELGAEAMSLYRYVPSKEALLFGLVEAIYDEIRPEYPPGADWEGRLRAVMHAYLQTGLAHPTIVLLSSSRAWFGIARRRLEEDIRTLREAGFPDDQAGYALRSLTNYTAGFLTRSITTLLHEPRAKETPGRARTPSELEEYPNLAACEVYIRYPGSAEAFEFGLDMIFTGLRAALSAAKAARQHESRGRSG